MDWRSPDWNTHGPIRYSWRSVQCARKHGCPWQLSPRDVGAGSVTPCTVEQPWVQGLDLSWTRKGLLKSVEVISLLWPLSGLGQRTPGWASTQHSFVQGLARGWIYSQVDISQGRWTERCWAGKVLVLRGESWKKVVSLLWDIVSHSGGVQSLRSHPCFRLEDDITAQVDRTQGRPGNHPETIWPI